MTEGIVVGAVASALYELVAHWFPYQRFNGGHDLPRVANYVIGCVGVLLGMVVWGALARDASISPWTAVSVTGVMFGSSGGAVVLAYGVDKVAEWRCYKEGRQAMDEVVSVGMDPTN